MSAAGSILHERATHHHWQGYGPLSIKAFFAGQAAYEVEGARYVVDASVYLVLNEGQHYTIDIAGAAPVESFCVFFAPGLVNDVLRTMATPTGPLLDAPEAAAQCSPAFFERTYPHDRVLSPAIYHLRAAMRAGRPESGWLDEQYHQLVERLLRVHAETCSEVEALPAAKASTREELYRRLWIARDYLAALAFTPVSLDELAHVACLSPNHLLRTFKAAFGETPHQYLTGRRLQRACELLRATDRPITEICLAVGFQSLGTFSALFRKHLGISPIHYRRQGQGTR